MAERGDRRLGASGLLIEAMPAIVYYVRQSAL